MNTPSWTVIFYMIADTDMETAARDTIARLAQLRLSSTKLAISLNTRASSQMLVHESGAWTAPVAIPHADASAQDGLQRFLKEQVRKGDNVCLIIWGHGGGFEYQTPRAIRPLVPNMGTDPANVPAIVAKVGRAPDNANTTASRAAKDYLEIDEIRNAIEASVGTVNVLTCHACLMSMLELALEVHDVAEFMVASEVLVREEALPYETILPLLEQAPASPADLAKLMVQQFESANANREPPPAARWQDHGTLSALSGTTAASLAASFSVLAEALREQVKSEKGWAILRDRRYQMVSLYNPDYVDLGSFLDNVERSSLVAPALVEAVRTPLKEELVLARFGIEDDEKSGVSIYFPDNKEEEASLGDYAKLRFNKHPAWLEFLRAYLARIPDPTRRTDTQLVATA